MLLAGVPTVAFAEGTGQDTMTEPLVIAEPAPGVGSTHVVGGNAYKVTSNNPKAVAFVKSKNANSVTVPDSVKIAGQVYPVTSIAAKAFAPAKKNLTTVKIGKNVTVVGASAFAGCAKLKTVTGGAAVTTIKASAFKGCKVMTKCTPLASKKLKTIGASALYGCKAIRTVTIGKAVTSIGKAAFYGCIKLKTVKGGAGVVTIGARAFKGCKVMTGCAPFSSKKLKKIGAYALSGAKKLTVLTLKTKKLSKKSVKGSLKGSSVKTVRVKVGTIAANKKYVKKYKKIFTKTNCGKKVKVK